MSLLSHEEWNIVLYPDRAQMVRVARELSVRGMAWRVLAKHSVPCDEGAADAPWSGALLALDAALSGQGAGAAATVILSNRFMHYALVPWSAALSDEAEEMAFARHCFKEMYGEVAEQWELRVNPENPGRARLASAVDRRLPAELRALFGRRGVRLASIQPHLMTVFNNCRASLGERNAWFVVVEDGNLCLVRLYQGSWISVRSTRVGSDWSGLLPSILEREGYLADCVAANEVLIWAPDSGNAAVSANGSWAVRKLNPVIRAGYVREYERQFATAMSI